jgi:hypothetical protein
VGLVGAVEWSMKPGSQYLRPAIPVLHGESQNRRSEYNPQPGQ